MNCEISQDRRMIFSVVSFRRLISYKLDQKVVSFLMIPLFDALCDVIFEECVKESNRLNLTHAIRQTSNSWEIVFMGKIINLEFEWEIVSCKREYPFHRRKAIIAKSDGDCMGVDSILEKFAEKLGEFAKSASIHQLLQMAREKTTEEEMINFNPEIRKFLQLA